MACRTENDAGYPGLEDPVRNNKSHPKSSGDFRTDGWEKISQDMISVDAI